ncbi:tetratricopeptide repeat protein [Streptomyces resistomycificus]|nr:tetratricopeptide repeat protein [Streptomyces resistomycificus]
MDIDRFFALGPDASIQANDVFTDREQYIAAFHERLLAHCSRSWSTADLMDFQRPLRNVMAVVGEGGIGKSTMVRHLASLTVQGEPAALPGNRATATVDFANVSSLSFETVLLRVRAALGGLGKSWPAFDIALALYWERKHPGESVVTFLRRSSEAGEAMTSMRTSEQISSALDEFLGGFGMFSLGYQLAQMAGRKAARSAALRRIRRELPAFDLLIDERDPDRMLGYLPVLLGYDLEQIRQRTPTLAVCVLDTFEHVQMLPAERNGLEDLIVRMTYLMPNVFFIVASRRPLLWHDAVRSVGLMYGGHLRWPGLGETSGLGDQFQLDGFDEAAAERYLLDRLTRDGQPAIPEVIRRRIIASSGGSPHYLKLSAGLFEQIAARGEEPVVTLFGRPFPELLLRVMRDLSTEDRDLLRAAALLDAFDENLLAAVVPQARGRQIESFLRRRFIEREDEAWPPYRLHENLRKGVADCDGHTPDGWTTAERRRNLLRATAYLEDLVLSVWNPDDNSPVRPEELSRRSVSAFLLALHAAREHGVLPPGLGQMLYTLRELGHWQVMASLPECGEEAPPDLRRLTAVARLNGLAGLNADERYEQMKAAAGEPTRGAYSEYVRYELGNLAYFVGKIEDSERHFASIASDPSPIGAGAQYGLASNALRHSRFTHTVRMTAKPPFRSKVEQMRATNMLGRVELYNARFEQAADLFEAALAQAREVDAPLWAARTSRSLALACVWFDPGRALALLLQARELNNTLGEMVGLAQCHTAAALAHALRGEWQEVDSDLDRARCGFEAVGAEFELGPVPPIDILLRVAQGRTAEALAETRRLTDAERAGRRLAPPAWAAVSALWVDRPDWFDFDTIDWIEPATARDRWLAPLTRLLGTLRA